VGLEEITSRFAPAVRVWLNSGSVQADRTVGQNSKMIDMALGHMSDHHLIFQNFSFEVTFGHAPSASSLRIRVRQPDGLVHCGTIAPLLGRQLHDGFVEMRGNCQCAVSGLLCSLPPAVEGVLGHHIISAKISMQKS
jgi:hypothetical protein